MGWRGPFIRHSLRFFRSNRVHALVRRPCDPLDRVFGQFGAPGNGMTPRYSSIEAWRTAFEVSSASAGPLHRKCKCLIPRVVPIVSVVHIGVMLRPRLCVHLLIESLQNE